MCPGESVTAKVACVVAKLRTIASSGRDEPDERVNLMLEAIRECVSSWNRNNAVEYQPVPTDGFEYEAHTLWEMFVLFGTREMGTYANNVKRKWQAPTEKDDNSWRREEENDDEPDLPTVSVCVYLRVGSVPRFFLNMKMNRKD